MLYSKYLSLVLAQFVAQPAGLICYANDIVASDHGRVFAGYNIYHQRLENSIAKTFGITADSRRIVEELHYTGFRTEFADHRKHNSYIYKILAFHNLSTKDRNVLMERFRIKYLQQLIRLAKKDEVQPYDKNQNQ